MFLPGHFEILEAQDGIEGSNLIRQQRPSLIFLDWGLPQLSSWEIFKQILLIRVLLQKYQCLQKSLNQILYWLWLM